LITKRILLHGGLSDLIYPGPLLQQDSFAAMNSRFRQRPLSPLLAAVQPWTAKAKWCSSKIADQRTLVVSMWVGWELVSSEPAIRQSPETPGFAWEVELVYFEVGVLG
jgi:hypothetical protein